jgi:hypothetical protein
MAYFEISSESRVAVAWFLTWRGGDLLALVHSDSATSPWQMTSRIRRRVDDEISPNLTKDTKTGYRVDGTPDDASRDYLVEGADRMIKMMRRRMRGTLRARLEIYGDGDAFMAEWAKQPFTYVTVPAKDPGRVQ